MFYDRVSIYYSRLKYNKTGLPSPCGAFHVSSYEISWKFKTVRNLQIITQNHDYGIICVISEEYVKDDNISPFEN